MSAPVRTGPPAPGSLDEAAPGKPARRFAVMSVGLASSGLFLWLALRGVDLGSVGATLARASWWPFAPCAVALVACFWLKLERWHRLLRVERPISRARLTVPMMMGFAANNVLPLRAGELVRVLVAGRYLGVSKTRVFASLLVERVLDALSIAMLTGIAIAYLLLGDATGALDVRLLVTASIAAVVAGAVLVALTGAARLDPDRLGARLGARLGTRLGKGLPAGRGASVKRFFHQLLVGLEPIARGRVLARTLANSMLQWLLLSSCVYLSIGAVGIEIRSGAAAMVVLGLVVLGISVPSGPAYVGNMEYAFVLGLGFFGVPATQALAAGIYYHAFMFVGVTSAGAACWIPYALHEGRQRTVVARE